MGVRVRQKAKGSGVWWVYVAHQGRRTSRKVGTEEAALEVARKIEARLTLGEEFLPTKKAIVPTVGEYWKRFESTYLRSAVAESTASGYRTNFRVHILPALGKKQLDAVTESDMEQFIASLVHSKKLARPTIDMILRQFGRMYSRARKHKLVDENPASGHRELYQQAPIRHDEIEPLSHDEVPIFLQAVTARCPQYYALFLCAIHSGMRAGELAGLQWGDVDFNSKTITVRRSIDRVRRKVVRPKSDKSRTIEVSDELITALKNQLREQKAEWLKRGSEHPDYVFANSEGSWSDMANIRGRHFSKCLEAAGLSHRRLHDLRHTYASLLLTDGAPMAYVSDMMGHSSIELTVKRYGHLIPKRNRHFVNALPGGTVIPITKTVAG
jgi:integrase